MTIAIIAIAVIALVGALADTIATSSAHRRHATAETIARNVAEALKRRTTPDSFHKNEVYNAADWSTVNTTGFKVTATAECWTAPSGAGNTQATFAASGNCTSLLQRITVTAESARGDKQSVVILKRQIS